MAPAAFPLTACLAPSPARVVLTRVLADICWDFAVGLWRGGRYATAAGVLARRGNLGADSQGRRSGDDVAGSTRSGKRQGAPTRLPRTVTLLTLHTGVRAPGTGSRGISAALSHTARGRPRRQARDANAQAEPRSRRSPQRPPGRRSRPRACGRGGAGPRVSGASLRCVTSLRGSSSCHRASRPQPWAPLWGAHCSEDSKEPGPGLAAPQFLLCHGEPHLRKVHGQCVTGHLPALSAPGPRGECWLPGPQPSCPCRTPHNGDNRGVSGDVSSRWERARCPEEAPFAAGRPPTRRLGEAAPGGGC